MFPSLRCKKKPDIDAAGAAKDIRTFELLKMFDKHDESAIRSLQKDQHSGSGQCI